MNDSELMTNDRLRSEVIGQLFKHHLYQLAWKGVLYCSIGIHYSGGWKSDSSQTLIAITFAMLFGIVSEASWFMWPKIRRHEFLVDNFFEEYKRRYLKERLSRSAYQIASSNWIRETHDELVAGSDSLS